MRILIIGAGVIGSNLMHYGELNKERCFWKDVKTFFRRNQKQ